MRIIVDSVLFSQSQSQKNFLNMVFPNKRPAKGCPWRFRSKWTTGSSMFDHDFGHSGRGRRIQISGHSDSGILERPPFLLECKRILRLVLVLHHSVILQWHPLLLRQHRFQLRIFEMRDVHQRSKNGLCSPLCVQINLPFCSWSISSESFLVDSWASTMHACFVFWTLLDPLVSSSVSRHMLGRLLGRLVVLSLQGIAASIGISNFSMRVWWFSWALHHPIK